jgi:branched-chain amino acid transport system permease protein
MYFVQQLFDGVVLGSIYVLFAVGLTLVWGVLNLLNLAHGAVFVFTAYIVFKISEHAHATGLALPLLVVVGAAIGGATGVLIELTTFRFIRDRMPDLREGELTMLIASIGLAGILTTIVNNGTGESNFSVPTTFHEHGYHAGSVLISNIQIVVIVAGIGLTALLAAWVRYTRGGRALRSVAVDADTASLMGINPNALSVVTMLVSGVLAGVAGVLLAVYLGSVDVNVGSSLLIYAFVALVVGGVGSVVGAAIGAFALSLVQTLLVGYTSGSYSDVVAFGLVIILLVVRPQGILGLKRIDRV